MRYSSRTAQIGKVLGNAALTWLTVWIVQFLLSQALDTSFRIDSWPVHRLALLAAAFTVIIMATVQILLARFRKELSIALVVVVLLCVAWGALGYFDITVFALSPMIFEGTAFANTNIAPYFMPSAIVLSVVFAAIDNFSKPPR